MERFSTVTSNELKEHIDFITPENTIKINWAKKFFNYQLQVWQIHIDEVPKVFKCCDEMTLEDLDHCLQYFFVEVRKQNGKRYPPGSLKDLASMVQLYFHKIGKTT